MFLPFSLILSTKSSIKSMILIWFDLFSDSSLFRNISIDWLIDCLFVWNRFLITIHDSIIIKISILPDYYDVLLYHFNNDTELWLLFQSINQSIIVFDHHYHYHYYYYQWPNDHILNIHKWWIQSTNNNNNNIQMMVWIGLN